MSVKRFELAARPPFEFDLALAYLARSPDEVLDVVEEGAHRRVVAGGVGPALIEIRHAEVNGTPGIRASVLVGTLSDDALAAFVRRIYRLDDNRSCLPTRDLLSRQLVDHFAGLPLVQQASPFEALSWAVLGQQINVAFAYRLKRRFVERFGKPVRYEGRTYYLFPTPERTARLDHERDLRPLQFSRQKSRYIIEAARAALDGRLDFEAIEKLDDESARLKLQEQPGVGRWTAEYVLMRGLARRDVIPAGDAGLRYAVGRQLGLDGNASEEQVREFADAWRPYRAEMAFRIWFGFQRGWFDRKRGARLGG